MIVSWAPLGEHSMQRVPEKYATAGSDSKAGSLGRRAKRDWNRYVIAASLCCRQHGQMVARLGGVRGQMRMAAPACPPGPWPGTWSLTVVPVQGGAVRLTSTFCRRSLHVNEHCGRRLASKHGQRSSCWVPCSMLAAPVCSPVRCGAGVSHEYTLPFDTCT